MTSKGFHGEMMTRILGFGTAVPDHAIDQEAALRFMKALHLFDDGPASRRLERRLNIIYRRSGIERRYSCCPEYALGEAGRLPSGWGLDRRMERYKSEVAHLARQAALNALENSQSDPGEITHILFATCTGFVAPGPDLAVAGALGLSPDIRRVQIGFMGCQAALHGLQVANAFCDSDRTARVLLICAELCTLHFRETVDDETLIANCLFGDGAAAAVLAGDDCDRGFLSISGFSSRVFPDSADLLTWRIGDSSFIMGLDLSTPRAISKSLPAFARNLGAADGDPNNWAVHPGGPAILEATERAANFPPGALRVSREILRDYGNMSSPTTLFVLDRVAAGMKPGEEGVAMAFGPGLSVEAMRFAYCGT